jgi:hypothetical protein
VGGSRARVDPAATSDTGRRLRDKEARQHQLPQVRWPALQRELKRPVDSCPRDPEPSQRCVELFAPSSHVSALANVPTNSGIQDMFPYDRNPL